MVETTPADVLGEWSWLSEEPADIQLSIGSFNVVAVVFELESEAETERCMDAVRLSTIKPNRVVVPELIPDDAEWIWALPNTCTPKPDVLQQLLSRAAKNPEIDIVAAAQTTPQGRGATTLIHSYGQSVSGFGRLRTLSEPGEFYQGQLQVVEVLGAPAAGMLIKGSLWRYLEGFEQELTPSLWGLEFSWLANLVGAKVVVEPDAEIVMHEGVKPISERAGILALASAHAKRGTRWLTDLKLILVTLLVGLGFVIGKDPMSAGEEIAGLGRWLTSRKLRKQIRSRVRALDTTPEWEAATRRLRPARLSGLRRIFDSLAFRVADWFGTFTESSDEAGIDEMTGGDDYISGPKQRKLQVVLVGLGLTLTAAVVAGRTMFGEGSLRAARMLPASDSWQTMVSNYLTPIPGLQPLATPPWEAICGLVSLLTLGSPEWFVTVVVFGCVPLTWLAAYRLLRQFCTSNAMAGIAAGAFGLAPILSGAYNTTGFAASIWTALLPVAAYSLLWWQKEGQGTWRGVGAVGFWLLILTAIYPPTWILAAVGFVGELIVRPGFKAVVQRIFVLAVPGLLLLGAWREVLFEYPARALVGIEAALDTTAEFEWWHILFAATNAQTLGPPLWLSISCLGVLWLAAFVGACRKSSAALLFVVAVMLAVAAALLNRMLLFVPPGVWVRPTGMELITAMIGFLAMAAVVGLDKVSEELRNVSAGLRHFGVLALTILGVAALVTGSAWWVIAGGSGLSRAPVGQLPVFVMNEANSDKPGRILAIDINKMTRNVAWGLIENDYPRLGDAERGIAFGGDQTAEDFAASVVNRLITGSADDELVTDLVRLGVANVWVRSADEDVLLAINNTPGLEGATGLADMVWPVPDSGILTLWQGNQRELLGNDQLVRAGDGDKILWF
ncbi:MAG: hypothetical protein FWG47_07305, partial [Propionibacteriaceae bacterium]|nr:hypothetical protein [Propionibacteriaceae bacterium]